MRAAVSLLGVGLAACASPGASSGPAPSPSQRTLALMQLVGSWQWVHRTTEAGTTRVETERWQLHPTGVPTQLAGHYVRETEVRSDDRVPFECNQRTVYRQRATFELVLDVTPTGYALRETAVRAEPGPCDHGFRKLGTYAATLVDRGTLALAWEGGSQTLSRVTGAPSEPGEPATHPGPPPSATPTLAGAWRWASTSYDRDGNVQDELEWWSVTPRSASQIDATYRRRVTVRSPDSSWIACANASSWTYDDAYVLEGEREAEHWHLYERATQAGTHPCLEASPRRVLDEGTAEQRGDALVIEWRGKRRQVLER